MSRNKLQFKLQNCCRSGLICIIVWSLLSCGNGQAPALQHQAADSEQAGWSSIPLPDISQQPISLRVANVVNPRFKQLSQQQLEQILQRSQQLVKQYFNVDVVYSDVQTVTIEAVFKQLQPRVIAERQGEIVDIDLIDAQVREAMQQSLFKTLSNYSGNQQNVIAYAQPYLLHPEIKQQDFIGLSYALVDTLIARLRYWQSQTAADGKPVLDSTAYNEWVWWDSLGYGDLPYDVMITNQLVASAEYYGMDVHSSLRGGLTAGTTTYNKQSSLGSYAYIMVYPMLNDTDLLTTLRQDETYSQQQIIDYSAALLTHELGHLLLHLGHPFGRTPCIMSPTIMLHYRDWFDHLDAAQCAIGSSTEMTPGAAKIDYNRNW
jgi:hypothetical protein